MGHSTAPSLQNFPSGRFALIETTGMELNAATTRTRFVAALRQRVDRRTGTHQAGTHRRHPNAVSCHFRAKRIRVPTSANCSPSTARGVGTANESANRGDVEIRRTAGCAIRQHSLDAMQRAQKCTFIACVELGFRALKFIPVTSSSTQAARLLA